MKYEKIAHIDGKVVKYGQVKRYFVEPPAQAGLRQSRGGGRPLLPTGGEGGEEREHPGAREFLKVGRSMEDSLWILGNLKLTWRFLV